jgi:hypothetical protein
MLICIGLNRRHRSGVETLAATAQLCAIVSLEQPFFGLASVARTLHFA